MAAPSPWNPEGKKTILTLDGGGMRGAITAAMLAEFEHYSGQPLRDQFDMIAGTSTGAIIAAGIAVGMNARELLDEVYCKRLPEAFTKARGGSGLLADVLFYLRYALGGLRHIYPIKPFQEAMIPLAGGRKLNEIEYPILLMTTKDVRTGAMCYLVNKGPGAAAFGDVPLSGAVAASGAAPIFFPPVGGNLVDGGVGVDANPCLAAAVEAMEYLGEPFGFTPGNVIVMSMGTGYVPNEFNEGDAGRFNLVDWIRYLIVESLDDAALQQTLSTRAIYRDTVDFRRYNPALTGETLAALGISPLGKPNPRELSLDSYHMDQVHLMVDIGREYARRLDWTQPNIMPWNTEGGHAKPSIQRARIDWSKTPYAT